MSDFIEYVSSISLLEITKRNIRHLQIKESKYGIDVPPHIISQIEDEIDKLESIQRDILYKEGNIMAIFENYMNSIIEYKSNYRYKFKLNDKLIEIESLFIDIIKNDSGFIHINNIEFDIYFNDLLSYVLDAIRYTNMVPIYIDFSNKRVKDIDKFIRDNVHNLLRIKRKDVFYVLERSCKGNDIDFIPKIYFVFCNIDEIYKIKKDKSINKIKNFLSVLYRPCIFIYKSNVEYDSVFKFQNIYNITEVIEEFIEKEDSIIIDQDDLFPL